MVAGAACLVMGWAVFILPVVVGGFPGESFQGPGTHTIEIDDLGEWTVWFESSGVVNGSFRTGSSPPSGIQITVTHEGAHVPLRPLPGQTMTAGSTERLSLMAFEVATPGAYEVEVTGDFAPASFHVGRNDVVRLLTMIIANCFTSVLGIGLGIWGVVLLILRLVR